MDELGRRLAETHDKKNHKRALRIGPECEKVDKKSGYDLCIKVLNEA